MTIHLTPHVLETAYDFLRTTAPFSKWNLPEGEDCVFRVVRDPKVAGWHKFEKGKHILAVSARSVGHTMPLLEVIAHEMIHVHETVACTGTRNVEHNAAFREYAAQVTKIHGFDPKGF